MTKRTDFRLLALGVALILIPLVCVIAFPHREDTWPFLRIVASLGAGLVGTIIPGVLEIRVPGIRAVGAIALVVLFYRFNPPAVVNATVSDVTPEQKAEQENAVRSNRELRKQIAEYEAQAEKHEVKPAIPLKRVIRLNGGLYKTISYWYGGKESRTTWCQGEVTPVLGLTVVGASDTGSYDSRDIFKIRPPGNPRGCAPAGHCDSHNEFCMTFYRKEGCYVSSDWLEWYKQGRASSGLTDNIQDICAPSLPIANNTKSNESAGLVPQ